MTTRFQIDYSWLSRTHGDEVERVTLADIGIFVGDSCATTLEDVLAKTVRSSARLSAVRLAEWFAVNWWRLRWELPSNTLSWKMSHKVGNAGGGYVWPDLSFSSDWETIQVSARPTEGWEGEPIRYLKSFDTRISVVAFEKGVDNFIDGTIARLSSTLGTATELSDLWLQIAHERRDPELSESRKLEACMGYDPDEAADGLIRGLRDVQDRYGREAVREVAAVSRSQALTHMQTLWENAAGGDSVVQVDDFQNVRQRIVAQTNAFDVPWRRARRAAQIARDSWRLRGKVKTRTLSEIFNISERDILHGNADVSPPLTAGMRRDDNPGTYHIWLNRRHPTARRFAFARLLADHLAIPDNERLLPATDSKTSRQKFQRAFAQEFLCPFDDLKTRFDADTPTEDEIEDAADYFDVSPRLVETALVNNGMLDRDTLDDWRD